MSAAKNVSELRVGFCVQYLGYQAADSDYIKIVRIERILNDYWDVNADNEQVIQLYAFHLCELVSELQSINEIGSRR